MLYILFIYSFARYKENVIWRISFGKFSDVLPAFTCAKAIVNLQSICLGVNVVNPFPCIGFNGDIPFLKPLAVNSWSL